MKILTNSLLIIFYLIIYSTSAASNASAKNQIRPVTSTDSKDVLPTLHLLTPNGGEHWISGTLYEVVWSGTNLSGNILIEYSTDGVNWNNLDLGTGLDIGGRHWIRVPDFASTTVKFRVTSEFYPQVMDESDQSMTFVWQDPNPEIDFFLTHDHVYPGMKTEIGYYSCILTQSVPLNLYLSNDHGFSWSLIAQNLPFEPCQDQKYIWDVPNIVADSCIFKLEDVTNPSNYGISQPFHIYPTPSISIVSVNPAHLVRTGSEINIEYEKLDKGYFYYLSYSTDMGTSWKFADNIELTETHGIYTFSAPDQELSSCLYRITNDRAPWASDTTNEMIIRDFPETPVCQVSYNSSSAHNTIYWTHEASEYIDHYLVYRETTETGVYEQIGQVSKNDPAEFTDLASQPALQSYRYAMGYKDAGNLVYPMSEPHQTIHLSVYKSNGNGYNLIWNPYEGSIVSTCKVFRGSSLSNMSQITELSGNNTSYSDTDAPQGTVYYQLEAVFPEPCPGAGDHSVLSNSAHESSLGIEEQNRTQLITINPNPADQETFLTLHAPMPHGVCALIDQQSKVLRKFPIDSPSENSFKINLEDLKSGLYFMQFKADNYSETRKLIINH
ncbi:MAG: T9SS type A sorting domain-containing protein [Bacteroidetes bacterium]|nr:T9SS type A sorting domain-containing protein [Bacteroidota bacterium]